MATSYISHLNLGNINDPAFNYASSKEFRILNLRQSMQRSRNEAGIQYGPTHGALLEMQLFLTPDITKSKFVQNIKPFFEHLKSDEEFYYTVLYNRILTSKTDKTPERIEKYDGGFVVKGYIIGIEEDYSETLLNNLTSIDCILLNIKIQISKLCYLGESEQNHKTIRIFA